MARRSSWAFSSVRVNGESHVSSILFYHFTNTHIVYYPGLSRIVLTTRSKCRIWPVFKSSNTTPTIYQSYCTVHTFNEAAYSYVQSDDSVNINNPKLCYKV
jgi:hypothetical protein